MLYRAAIGALYRVYKGFGSWAAALKTPCSLALSGKRDLLLNMVFGFFFFSALRIGRGFVFPLGIMGKTGTAFLCLQPGPGEAFVASTWGQTCRLNRPSRAGAPAAVSAL